MTALPAQSLPAPRRRGAEGPQRRLRPAPEPKRARSPRVVYAIIAFGAVGLIVVAQMLLSIAMTEGAYEADHYESQQIELARQDQTLREQIDALESPQNLASRAGALGMVPNNAPVFLRLSTGAVSGQPTPAGGGSGGGAALVPNALLDGVPSDGGATTGETPGVAVGADGAQAPASGAAPIVPATGLPTPTTH